MKLENDVYLPHIVIHDPPHFEIFNPRMQSPKFYALITAHQCTLRITVRRPGIPPLVRAIDLTDPHSLQELGKSLGIN